jgi:hypothetical protein
MSYLTEKETEFYEWLDTCPVPYLLIAEETDFVSYNFSITDEESNN